MNFIKLINLSPEHENGAVGTERPVNGPEDGGVLLLDVKQGIEAIMQRKGRGSIVITMLKNAYHVEGSASELVNQLRADMEFMDFIKLTGLAIKPGEDDIDTIVQQSLRPSYTEDEFDIFLDVTRGFESIAERKGGGSIITTGMRGLYHVKENPKDVLTQLNIKLQMRAVKKMEKERSKPQEVPKDNGTDTKKY